MLDAEKGDVKKAADWLRAHGKDTPQKVWGEALYTNQGQGVIKGVKKENAFKGKTDGQGHKGH